MKNILLTAVVAIVASVLTFQFMPKPSADGSAKHKETAYERVQKKRELRCSYVAFDPFTIVDPNTGELSGIFYDLTNEIGRRLNIDVKWVEEVGYGTVNVGFETGRYDAFCTGLWPGATRALNTLFTNAIMYDPVGVFVAANDTRFDNNIGKLNSPDYSMTYMDGDVTEAMVAAIFPNAKKSPVSQLAGMGEYFQHISSGKADAGLGTKLVGINFMENNPDAIREVSLEKPVRMYPLTIGLPDGEYNLKKALDVVIFEMQDDGTVERIVKQYLGNKASMIYFKEATYRPYAE